VAGEEDERERNKTKKKKKAKIVNQPTGKFWKEREINNIDRKKP
jgi:hypothetical protein